MKRFVVLLLSFAVAYVSFAQNPSVIRQLEQRYGDKYTIRYDKGYYEIQLSSVNSPDAKRKCGLCSADGKEILPVKYDLIYLHTLEDGYIAVEYNHKRGIFDKTGKQLLDFKYDDVRWYQLDKYGCVEVVNNKKVGIINSSGEELVPCIYDEISIFYESCFVMKKNGKVGAARRDGSIILPCCYTDIMLHDDLLVVAKGPVVGKDLKYSWDVYSQLGAYNLDGKEIIPCRYSRIIPCYNLGNYVEVCNGKVLGKDADGNGYYSGPFGLYSKDGKEILPCIYGNPSIPYQTMLDDYFIVCKGGIVQPDFSVKGGKWGLVNKDNEIIIPFEYDAISRPSENVSSVCVGGECVFQPYPPKEYHGGKWGLFSLSSKKEIVPPTYDYILSFKNGLAQIKKNGVTSLVDLTMQLPNSNPEYHSDVDVGIPSTSQISENTFAFILTAENLPGGKTATAANNDGEVLKKYLEKTLGIPSKNILFYKDGTLGQFYSMIKRITDIADVYESDANIIVYLSGVGIADATSNERLFFPTDVSYDNIPSTAISIKEISNTLRDLESSCTIIVDSPFDGKDREGNNLLSGRGVIVSQNSIPVRDGLKILLSANNSGRSMLSEDGAHGLMTYVLLKNIRISHSFDMTLLNKVVNETAKMNRGVDILKPTLY